MSPMAFNDAHLSYSPSTKPGQLHQAVTIAEVARHHRPGPSATRSTVDIDPAVRVQRLAPPVAEGADLLCVGRPAVLQRNVMDREAIVEIRPFGEIDQHRDALAR